MQVIHRMGRKLVASVVVVLFVSLQVLPQGFAKQLPVEVQTQSQVSEQSPVSIPSSVIQESSSPTSIDFLAQSESPLSVPEPIVLPPDPRDIPPVPTSEIDIPLSLPIEGPVVEPRIDPSLLQNDPLITSEPIQVEPPIPQEELIPVGPPLEWDQPFSGHPGTSFEVIREETKAPESSGSESILQPKGFFSPIFGRMIATVQAMRSLVDRFHLSEEEKQEVLKDIKVVSVEKKTWSNGCMGWHTGPCTMGVVTGYQVILELYGNTYEFHAGKLDPAKEAAISAINHLMEHGTPKATWSDHIVHPKLSQIRIGNIRYTVKLEGGLPQNVFYDIDLRVEWNKRRSVTWRYTVDAETNEVVGRKLYGIRQLTEHIAMLFLIDYDHGERFRPKQPRAWREPDRHADARLSRFHRDVISHVRKLKEPKHGFGLAASYQEKIEMVNR